MSAEFYNPPSMSKQVRAARKLLRTMSRSEQIDIMVKAGVMTKAQAKQAKQNIQAAEAQAKVLKPTELA